MANRNQLSYGSQGSYVTELQKLLNQNGYNLQEDGIFGTKTQSAVREYQQKNGLAVDGIVGNNTWGSLLNPGTGTATSKPATNSGFTYDEYQESDAVKQAYELLQQQLAQKPGAYQSPWQSQLNDIIDKIMNREKFSYDLNGDALYQQYKDQYMSQGKMAMMDTMGQAAAMTGGYGNSYAQSVGQQTYQGYMQQLNDKMPELYQLALSKYQMEGDDLARQYSMLDAQEQQEYGRYRDTVTDWNAELARLQDQYNAERDYDYGKYADERDFGYGQYIDDRNYQYQKDRDAALDRQWQAEFDEAVRQFNFANKLGEFAETVSSGGGGSSGGGSGGGSGGSGASGSSGGSGGNGGGATETEEEMNEYVKNMLNNATSSQFNPEQVINANSSLSSEEREVALEILDAYISSGAMKTGGKL